MAISAEAVFDEVHVLAFDDGPRWSGAAQFGFQVTAFSRKDIPRVAARIRDSASLGVTVVWFSKGADPVGSLAHALRGTRNVVVVADFDDNDVAIMKNFRAQSFSNAVKMNRLRRKHPARLARAQKRLARMADALTFSNTALAEVYRQRLGAGEKPWAIVPHTRRVREAPIPLRERREGGLVLGFLGTVRPHKGAAELVAMMRHDRDVTLISFRQKWSPPSDCVQQWVTFPADTPLVELYDKIDFLVLPMDAHDEASVHQLPAKLVDAAVNGCPVAATPTPPIEEFAAGAILTVEGWEDSSAVSRALKAADLSALSEAVRHSFVEWFSPQATGEKIRDVALSHVRGGAGQ